MQNPIKDENQKLMPLRRLAEEYKIYDKNYLSILVQRKKLKAQRIGRNYYSTREWFYEYIELFACEGKRNINLSNKLTESRKKKVSFFVAQTQKIINSVTPHNINYKYWLIFIILITTTVVIYTNYKKSEIASQDTVNGRVAGAEEKVININKSELKDGYITINNDLYKVENSVSTNNEDVVMMEKVK